MLYRTVRYNFSLLESIILSIRSDRTWDENTHRNFMTALSDMDNNDMELIIIRSLFDVDDEEPRIYQLAELSAPEQTLLQLVGSVQVHLICVTHENQTNLTYSIL